MDGSKQLAEADLGDGKPVVKLLEEWGSREGVGTPGHVVIAYGLVNNREGLELAPKASEALRELHGKWTAAFVGSGE
jgi:hypothetical protein